MDQPHWADAGAGVGPALEAGREGPREGVREAGESGPSRASTRGPGFAPRKGVTSGFGVYKAASCPGRERS